MEPSRPSLDASRTKPLRAAVRVEGLLVVAGGEPARVGHHPDLQEVHGLGLRGVVLAVGDAGAGPHELDLAGPDDAAAARRVLVLEPALEDVGEDLHVAVAVRPEAGSGRDAVVVDHAQAAEAHVPRVVVLAERERVAAVEPAPVGLAALGGRSDGDHGFLLCTLVGGLCPQHTAPSPVIPRSDALPGDEESAGTADSSGPVPPESLGMTRRSTARPRLSSPYRAEEPHRRPLAEEAEALLRRRAARGGSRGPGPGPGRPSGRPRGPRGGRRPPRSAHGGRPRSSGGRPRPGTGASDGRAPSPLAQGVEVRAGVVLEDDEAQRGHGDEARPRPGPGRDGGEVGLGQGGRLRGIEDLGHRPLEAGEVAAERGPPHARGAARTPAGAGRGR